jgi:hypothetical protein
MNRLVVVVAVVFGVVIAAHLVGALISVFDDIRTATDLLDSGTMS